MPKVEIEIEVPESDGGASLIGHNIRTLLESIEFQKAIRGICGSDAKVTAIVVTGARPDTGARAYSVTGDVLP